MNNWMLNRSWMVLLVCFASVAGCNDNHDDHAGHDHSPKSKPVTPSAHDHDDHEGHDHDHDHDGHDEHEGHDHGQKDAPDVHAEHADEVTLAPEAIQRWGVRVEAASKQMLNESVVAPASVSFNLEAVAHVGSAVSGRVSNVRVRVGDSVNEGDVLLVIASPEWGQAQSDFLQKRGAVAMAEGAVETAQALHARAQGLYTESQGIALVEVQRRETEWRNTESALAAAKGLAAAAENLLQLLGMSRKAIETLATTSEINPEFTVRAPIAGRVIGKTVTVGESVSPDREALLVIANMATLWVIADVPEAAIGRVTIGSEATVTLPALRDARLEGVVSDIAAQLSPTTRTIAVRIEVRDSESRLRPGMFAQASITTAGPSSPLLAVPESAVQLVEGESCVFVPVDGEPNTFARRVVRLGRQIGQKVEVLEGLAEGERYVSEGSFILKADLGKAGAAHEH